MRDKNRISRILEKLEAVWSLYPDQRLMQLLLNILSEDETIFLFYVEDDEVEQLIDEVLLNYDK
jgi:uncharacterized protein YihD (DUF1040 family)